MTSICRNSKVNLRKMTKEKKYRLIALLFNLTIIVFVFFMVNYPEHFDEVDGFVLWPSLDEVIFTIYGELITNIFNTMTFGYNSVEGTILNWSHKILGYGFVFIVYRYRNECGRVVQDIVEKF